MANYSELCRFTSQDKIQTSHLFNKAIGIQLHIINSNLNDSQREVPVKDEIVYATSNDNIMMQKRQKKAIELHAESNFILFRFTVIFVFTFKFHRKCSEK